MGDKEGDSDVVVVVVDKVGDNAGFEMDRSEQADKDKGRDLIEEEQADKDSGRNARGKGGKDVIQEERGDNREDNSSSDESEEDKVDAESGDTDSDEDESEVKHHCYDSCLTRCCRCVSSVPSPSMATWVIFTMAVSACGGSLMVAAVRTRDLLNKGHTFIDLVDPICLGSLFGMVFIGVIFVIVATLSSYPMSGIAFGSPAKNICARALNIIMILLMLILQLAWVCISILLTVPVGLWLLLMILVKVMHVTTINLKNYALSETDQIFEGDALDRFYSNSQDVFVCYVIAFVASVIVTMCLTCFGMCAAANIAHLKENRFGLVDVYKNNDVSASKNSVVDTRM